MPKRPSAAPPASANGVLPRLKAVYEFMTRHELEALEIDEPGLKVKMVRRRSAAPAAIPVPVPVSAGAAPSQQTAPTASAPAPVESLPAGALAVKANMMGIFYRAASPSSPPFVKEGEKVSSGHVLCMIEAMKVFNEIKADFPCTILKVLVENGKPVKSGQDLILVSR